jgi:hypothetical protein
MDLFLKKCGMKVDRIVYGKGRLINCNLFRDMNIFTYYLI